MSNLPEVTVFGTSCWSILVPEPAAVPPNAERLSPQRETRGEEVRHLHLGQAGWERAALDASQGKRFCQAAGNPNGLTDISHRVKSQAEAASKQHRRSFGRSPHRWAMMPLDAHRGEQQTPSLCALSSLWLFLLL